MSSKRHVSPGNIRESVRHIRRRAEEGLGILHPQPVGQPPVPPPSASGLPLSTTIPVSTPPSTSSAPTAADNTRNSAWTKLETALRGLETCSGVFPPLKPAASALVECIRELSDVNKRRQEYLDLAVDLTSTVDSLTDYVRNSGSTKMFTSVSNFVNAIQQEIKRINEQQQRHFLSRLAKAEQEEEELFLCYHRIQSFFRQLQINTSLSVWSIVNEQLANSRLHQLSAAKEARYNSAQSEEPRRHKCSPGTRITILNSIASWTNQPDSPKVYWMNGMAGTGKTTIAYSLCDVLEETCQLGASFFCSRLLPDCRDVTKIVPTIAYQLARFSLSFQSALCDVLGRDPDIGNSRMDVQFDKLLGKPLLAVGEAMPSNVVIVIDALDECSDGNGTKNLLDILFHYAAGLPVKFFVTSRPEPAIEDKIRAQDDHSRSIFILHEIEKSIVQADIETYLRSELAPTSPSTYQVRQLAEQAGSLFIYAATTVRYISPDDTVVDSHERLATILEMTSTARSAKYEEIDGLYTAILEAALDSRRLELAERARIQLVLYTVICAREPMSTKALASLLKLDESKISLALKPLQSVLHVSEVSGVVSTLHASFPDYMLSRTRSARFFCNDTQHNEFLALRCLELMKDSLHFNICNLESSYLLDKDVPDLADRVDMMITPGLFYACLYWGSHLKHAHTFVEPCDLLQEFLSVRLLFWMEVLSLKKSIGLGDRILLQAYEWLNEHGAGSEIRTLLQDARRFVMFFGANATSGSTPHIYISTLPLWPRKRPLSKHYWKRAQGLIQTDEAAMRTDSSALLATWPTGAHLSCLSISPNGNRVASGFVDFTIQIWDTQTRSVMSGPLIGHNGSVSSVAFSTDSSLIVSGSEDCTIRIWDTQSGSVVAGPFTGHADSVTSVAFSSDGALVVSGSDDCTVRIWNARTGIIVVKPFRGHTNSVISTAFSSDGTRVISGSYDRTINIWDAQTGVVVGYAILATSVAFSPESNQIISGSQDGSILIRDIQSGTVLGRPLKGHTNWVTSVAISSDGTRFASGSQDHTIRIWDTRTGTFVTGPLEGHTDRVTSLVFSSDGTRIASGSDDHTIRIWDAHTGTLVAGPLMGHTDSVTLVAFLQDGTRVFSSSNDNTIRIWDAQTDVAGSLALVIRRAHTLVTFLFLAFVLSVLSAITTRLGVPISTIVDEKVQGHTDSVTSVAFSSDGARIVSGSDDRTIRIWDSRTGAVVAGPLEGTKSVKAVAFSSDDTRVVSGSYDRSTHAWEDLVDRNESATSVAISSDGTRVVSASGNSTIRVWSAQTDVVRNLVLSVQRFRNIFTFGLLSVVLSILFTTTYNMSSPDIVAGLLVCYLFALGSPVSSYSTHAVSGSHDLSIRVWNAQTGAVVAKLALKGQTDQVTSAVAISSDGTRVVSGSHDLTIRIWSTQTRAVVIGPIEGHTDRITSLAFSSDGSRVASGSRDSAIRVWDAHTGALMTGPFEGHIKSVTSLAFSSDDTLIVTGSRDCTIRIWDTHTGALMAGPFEGHTKSITSVAFSPDNAYVVSGSHDCTIRVWDAQSRDAKNWQINSSGWITTAKAQDLLFWAPQDLHNALRQPHNTLVIGSQGSLQLDFDGLLLGKRWAECYRRP